MSTKIPKLAAELVTLGGYNRATYTYTQVVTALTDSGLNAKAAREFLPRNAWTRACRKLAEERVIDVIREDDEDALFQFSKKFLGKDEADGGQEMKYQKETKILLDKATGKLKCKVEAVRQLAEKELDRCMVTRTNSDVSAIVRKLFKDHADLMPLPGQAGVFLVVIEHQEFLSRIKDFLVRLGRKPYVLPIPAGVGDSDKTVQDTVMEYLAGLVEEHKAAVAGFSESTRNGTVEAARERITKTRIKVEAYALYLGDLKDSLLELVDEARAELDEAVAKLTTKPAAAEEEEAPEEPEPAPEQEPEEDILAEGEMAQEERVEEHEEIDF